MKDLNLELISIWLESHISHLDCMTLQNYVCVCIIYIYRERERESAILNTYTICILLHITLYIFKILL